MESEIALICAHDPAYFIDEFCWIEDMVKREWVEFKLWEKQMHALKIIHANSQVIVLKARQLGLTWLAVCYALWTMLFMQGSGILLFSRRESEASELIDRMRGVHNRLPDELRAVVTASNAQGMELGEIGSWVRCFPTSKHSGRSFSATMAIVDEADFIPDMKQLLNAVKPTVDGGGKLVLISTANKEVQDSAYKRVWRGAVVGTSRYQPIFLPWHAHPDRDQAWYDRQGTDYEQDDLYQEYPANPEQALSARQSSKRFPTEWLTNCRGNRVPVADKLGIPGFTAYVKPEKGREYLVSADPAEGSPNSDPSAAVVLDTGSWEQVGVLHGRYEADIFAGYLAEIAKHYNKAVILVERNNHGHAVLLALENAGTDSYFKSEGGSSPSDKANTVCPNIYISPMDNKKGWLSNRRDKILAVNNTAKALREGCCRINHEGTLAELTALEAGTLKAPNGQHDDLAMAFINGLAGLQWSSYVEQRGAGESIVIEYPDILEGMREAF